MIKPVKRRIGLFAALLGIFLLCIQRPALPSTVDFLKTSKVVPGEVVKLVPDGKHPQVEFTTLDGQHISVTASSESSLSVGDKVQMRYDPRQPYVAEVSTLWDVWGVRLFFAWPAMGLLVGELLGLSARWKSISEGNR
ncbi:DUF3592 domain-containing protein [Caballeronia sp. LZ029]|uniref:DUF3592 domain-containing protein n=1 Tax=Caballeronia sp. LZ029 TaxID=3038564 RepID=UPI00285A48F3|nr:DUF3592 domain-containing protein [Caballeronia sp. LZ029]MDR5745115.1 DUF3592 domain-containing protein [Caballeronia sp. LZ029]